MSSFHAFIFQQGAIFNREGKIEELIDNRNTHKANTAGKTKNKIANSTPAISFAFLVDHQESGPGQNSKTGVELFDMFTIYTVSFCNHLFLLNPQNNFNGQNFTCET